MTVGLCVAIGLVVVVGIAVVGVSSRPTSDHDLLALARGTQQQLGWDGSAIDETDNLSDSDDVVGRVRLAHSGGEVIFARYGSISERKSAQVATTTPNAGCRDILATFAYPDATVAQAQAATVLNMMTFLSAGDCESSKKAPAPSSTTSTAVAPAAPSRAFQIEMDSCSRDEFGFIQVKGRIANFTATPKSYYVEVQFLSESGVRLDYGNDIVPSVDPGQTAVWTAFGVVQSSGAFTCDYHAEEL